MSFEIEPINIAHHASSVEEGHIVLSEKNASVFLSRNVKRKDSLLNQLANISIDLYQLALNNKPFFNVLRMNPGLVYLLKTNPKLLNVAIQNPTFLDELINEPQKFIEKSKPVEQDKTTKSTRGKSGEISKSRSRKQAAFDGVTVSTSQSSGKTTSAKQASVKVNALPHKLESEVVAKAHIENPNTGIPVGDFRTLARTNIKNLPHDLELRPELITNARAFSLSPELLALMSAQAIATSRTKKLSVSGNPDDDDYDVENETEEALFAEKDVIKEVSKVDSSEAPNKILPHVK